MTEQIRHPNLRRLLLLWLEETKELAQSASLGTMTARDIEFFRGVFKDGFVAHGPREGPYRLSFVGTDLEAHLGRKLVNTPFGLGLPHAAAVEVENAFIEIAKTQRPLLLKARLTSPNRPDRLEVEVLCLPFGDAAVDRSVAANEHEVSILGVFAVIGLGALPPEPTHTKLQIASMKIL